MMFTIPIEKLEGVFWTLAFTFSLWFTIDAPRVLTTLTFGRVRLNPWITWFYRFCGFNFVVGSISSFIARYGFRRAWFFIPLGILISVFVLKRRDGRTPRVSPGPAVDYAAAWQQYRKLRRMYLFLLLSFVPIFLLAAWLSRFLNSLIPATIVLGAFAVSLVALGGQIRFWPCPRCHYSFRGWWPWLPRKCHNCKLPRWATSDASTNKLYVQSPSLEQHLP